MRLGQSFKPAPSLERIWNGHAEKGGKELWAASSVIWLSRALSMTLGNAREPTALLPKPGVVGSSPIVRFIETEPKLSYLREFGVSEHDFYCR